LIFINLSNKPTTAKIEDLYTESLCCDDISQKKKLETNPSQKNFFNNKYCLAQIREEKKV
jgi:hypothetical protein